MFVTPHHRGSTSLVTETELDYKIATIPHGRLEEGQGMPQELHLNYSR